MVDDEFAGHSMPTHPVLATVSFQVPVHNQHHNSSMKDRPFIWTCHALAVPQWDLGFMIHAVTIWVVYWAKHVNIERESALYLEKIRQQKPKKGTDRAGSNEAS